MVLLETLTTLSTSILFVSVILDVFLGYIVYRSNTASATNRLFVFLTICISIWMSVFFVSLRPFSPEISLQWIRWSLFVTVPMNAVFILLANTFPGDKFLVRKRYLIALFIAAATTACIVILPYTFTSVTLVSGFPTPVAGWGIGLFTIFIVATNAITLIEMTKRYRNSDGVVKKQIGYLFFATVVFLVFMFAFVLLPVMAFQNASLVPLAPLFTLVFVSTVTYASFRHQLFSVKVIATEAFVTILSIVFFSRIFSAASTSDRFMEIIIFIATVCFGILLVRSVKQEVKAREEIKKLADQLAGAVGQLEESNEQLRIIDQRKSEFVSIVSHQLRTPITAIKGYASLLLEDTFGSIAPEVKIPIEKIFQSSKRLADMVTDYLDISKIEQGTMTYTLIPVDIGTMVKDLGDDFVQVAAKKGLTFVVHIPDDKCIAMADDGKIRQIFSNLFDNSIKYTPKGSVDVFVAKDTERGVISIKIVDTGIGLSQDDIHHLFGKFTRGSGGQKQNTEGSGLGLYVARKMLEAQKGSIWVDSDGPGKGSTFFIELPAV